MRVQVVAPHAPHEGVLHAGGAYLLAHLRLVAERHQVSWLGPDRPGTREEAARAPEWLDVQLAPDADARAGSLLWQADRVMRRLRGPAPPPQTLRGLRAAGLVARARAADLVELHWPEYAFLSLVLRRAGVRTPLVVFAHDVHSQAAARRVEAYGDRTDRLAAAALHRHLVRQERRALDAADLVVVFKGADAQLLEQLGVRTRVHVTEPWLDPPTGAATPRVPGTVLFTGAMWRRENEDGVLWFLDQVWPQVTAAVPEARLVLAGAGPGARLLDRAARSPRVTVTGELPRLEDCYLEAAVFVAPLFVGGGLKFKVPQAMLHALPVIATGVAAEGVVEEAPAGTFWAVTDDPRAMADAVVSALQRPAAAAEVGRRAAEWVGRRYGFRASAEQLLATYAELTA